MKIARSLAWVLQFSLLAACATTSDNTVSGDDGTIINPKSAQTGVILGAGADCMFTETEEKVTEELIPIGVIAGALIPSIVDQGFSAVAAWLESKRKQREAQLNATWTGRGASELYARDGTARLNCVMIYRGERGTAASESNGWSIEDLKTLGLVSAPDFFFELRPQFSNDRTAIRFTPQHLEYRKTAATNSKGSKDILVLGLINGVVRDQETFVVGDLGSFQFFFPALAESTTLTNEFFAGVSSGWIPVPPARKTNSNDISYTVPISVLATVAEHEPGGDALLGVLGAMSAAVSESKDDVSKQIADEIIQRLGLDAAE